MFLWIFLGTDNCLFPPTVCWGLKWVFERFSTISTQFSTVERENSVESWPNWGAAHAQKHRFPQAHSGHTVPLADLRSGRAYGEGHGSKRQRLHPPLHREKSYKSEMEVLYPIHREHSTQARHTASFAPTARAAAANRSDGILHSTGESPTEADGKSYCPPTGSIPQRQAEKYARWGIPSLRHEQTPQFPLYK